MSKLKIIIYVFILQVMGCGFFFAEYDPTTKSAENEALVKFSHKSNLSNAVIGKPYT